MPGNLIDLSKYIKGKINKKKFGTHNTKVETIEVLHKLDERLDGIIKNLSEIQFDYQEQTLADKMSTRKVFEKKRLTAALEMLTAFESTTESLLENHPKLKKKILKTLTGVIQHIDFILNKDDGQIEFIRHFNPNLNNTYLAAMLFAVDIIPFNQSYDPFYGVSDGNCWGHTYHWSEMVSSKMPIDLRMITDNKILEDQKRNCTMNEVINKRVKFYKINDLNYGDAVWDIVNRLKPEDMFTLDYKEPNKIWGFHATGIRLYGESGIEFKDSNEGVFRFETKHDFVNFYILYLQNISNEKKADVSFLTVFRLPYKNDPFFDYKKINIPLCTEKEKLEAIKNYRSKIPMRKYQHNSEQRILDLKESELLQTISVDMDKNIFKELILTISTSIPPDKSSSFKVFSKKSDKILKIKQALTDFSEYASSQHKDNYHHQACLLFALMRDSLSLIPELKEKIELWLKEQMVDRELIAFYEKNIPSQKINLEETKEDNESEKNSKVSTLIFADSIPPEQKNIPEDNTSLDDSKKRNSLTE